MRNLIFTFFTFFPFLLFASENSSDNATQSMDMSPLFFIIMALFIGINTKRFLRKVPIPYTVILLLIGLVIGVLNRIEWVQGFSLLTNSIDWAAHIESKIILYVFLPTLIFEAAFDLDVHTFKKSFWNAFLMAVPGIAIAIGVTTLMVIGLRELNIGFNHWDWKIAAMFGAVICATDPVAVVSLLKELGGGKKLRTLIESESLLDRASHVGEQIRTGLESLQADGLIESWRGTGAVYAVEISQDPIKTRNEILSNGVILRAITNALAICPPLTISDAEIGQVIDTMAEVLK